MAINADAVLIAVQRFGLGAGPGELAAVARDPRGWAVAGATRAPDAPPGEATDAQEAVALFLERRETVGRQARERTQMEGGGMGAPRSEPPPRPRNAAERGFTAPGEVVERDLLARVSLATTTQAPLAERLVLHWSDHFTASTASGFVGYFAGAFERDAIRTHLQGRFADMLTAAVLHPAMLFYLDNNNSVGPGSPQGQRSRGRRGLNENLGREVLELHTLGVDGGYTQDDVIAMAKVLTGWSVDIAPVARDPQRIGFRPEVHEPGPKTVLGKTYPQDGPEQAMAVLRDLARHPSTARHAARRLVRHMIGHGQPALEARMAEVFRRTDGDLAAVHRALVADADAWGPPRKVRPPIELVFAAARLLGRPPPAPPPVRALRAMGQPFWQAPVPKGWPDGDEAWAAPDALKTRLDWSGEVAGRMAAGTDARALLTAAFGPAASAETRRTIERAADARQALTLLLMSPEFQRR